MSNKGGNKREKFLESVRKQKLDTVRWSLGAGGQSPSVRDDEGYTSIMIAAAGNLHKVLRMLVDHTRKTREREQMDLKDGAGDGRTALMMAAAHGHAEACQELLDAGCNFRLKCDRGKTAAEYAAKAGHDALAARINRGGESSEEDTDDEDDVVDPDAPEGETATQRSKRKKKELEAKERRGGAGDEHAAQEAARRAAAEAEAIAAAVLEKERPKPVWEEVKKAIDSDAKELTLEGAFVELPSGEEVDPATWWATATNTLKISLGMTFVPHDISRLSGLRTLILSGNALRTLPESIGELSQLKVLEVEDNRLERLPSSLANCGSLENLRLANNALTDSACDVLSGCVGLVTLVLDGNPELADLTGMAFETKERLVTFSAKRCAIRAVPESLGKCSLLAEIFLSDNAIGDLPMALGELKEKKVRALDFDGNPLNDPKVKKMISKSANLVKELLVYVRKNGVRGGGGGGGGKGGKGKKGKGKKKAVTESDESDEEADGDDDTREPPPPPPAPEKRAEPVAEAETAAAAGAPRAGDSDSDSEDEEELRERMSRMSKKERVKAERKLAERRSAKAAKAAAAKRAAAETAAAVQRAAAVDAAALGDDESDIDSDDEEALLERKQRARAAAAGGGAYTLTPEQRAAAEKAEAERAARVQAERDAAEAAERAKKEAKDAEEAFAKMRLKEAADGVVMTWLYEKGAIQRKPGGIPFKPGKKPGEPPTILCVIPAMVVGRIIGKAGATIREIEARSKARVSIQEGKGGPGMATLSVVGDDRAAESVRMMVNNAVGGGKR